MKNNEIIVLIPAYEPDKKMLKLLKELKETNLRVIIVNDGSGKDYDDIFKEAEKYGKVLTHETNKGKGRALKTGLEYIYQNIKGNYIVVTVDCDGQHQIKDALNLCGYAASHEEELVLGKRIRSGKTPIRSRIGNGITRFIYRITTGLDVYDTQTGLRAFSKKLIPFMLDIEGERFEYEMNVLLKCALNKIKIKELKIKTIYIDNNSHSHFKTIRDSILIYKEIFKFLLSSFLSFIVDYLLYTILMLSTNKLVLSNTIARIISATLNYNLNKRKVFHNKENSLKQVFSYILLASIILILNTIILKLFVETLSINKYVAKIITEIILLTISFFVQKKIIFKKTN